MFNTRNFVFFVSAAMLVVACLVYLCFPLPQKVDVNVETNATEAGSLPILEHPPIFSRGRTWVYRDGKYVSDSPVMTPTMPTPEIHLEAEEESNPKN